MTQPIIINTQNYLRSPWKLVPENSWYEHEENDPFSRFIPSVQIELFGVTRAEQTVRAINGEAVTIPVDLRWEIRREPGSRFSIDIEKTDYLGPPDVYVLDEDEIQMYQAGDRAVLENRSIIDLDNESILRDEIEEHFTRREILDAANAWSEAELIFESDWFDEDRHFTGASFIDRTAQIERGNIVTDVEGLDLGPDGAVVTRVDDDKVELARLDNGELVQIDISAVDYHAHEAPELKDLGNSQYDEEAIDSPEIHNIRSLPTYWGPRDPNNPSTLTDVSWRPEPYWRRRQHRYYSTEKPMRDRRRRRAEPLPTMDPLPHEEDLPERLQTDYGLPRRMQLQNWEEQDDHAFDTETLIDLVVNFWKGYRLKRTEHLPEVGSHKSLDLVDWILIFEKRHDMDYDEMLLLLDFMVATDLIPEFERERFVDMLDAYAVHRYHQI